MHFQDKRHRKKITDLSCLGSERGSIIGRDDGEDETPAWEIKFMSHRTRKLTQYKQPQAYNPLT